MSVDFVAKLQELKEEGKKLLGGEEAMKDGTSNSYFARFFPVKELEPKGVTWNVLGFDVPAGTWGDRATVIATIVGLPMATIATVAYARVAFFYLRHGMRPYPDGYVKRFGLRRQWDEAYVDRVVNQQYTYGNKQLQRDFFKAGVALVGWSAWMKHLFDYTKRCRRHDPTSTRD